MAQVFRATALGAEGFEKAVAIKRILPSLAGEGFQRRFVTEAKLSAQLTHPNIVQVIDFGRADGSLYIAMEYVDGVDALVLLERGPGSQVPVAAALYVALATCRGLGFAHARGVVHRDVSPSNILLSVTGAVKVADFGIAHTVDGQSMPRQIVGKLCYMSPEQIRGDAIDARTDVFSAGIVFHELLASRRLFRGGNFDELREAIDRQPIPSVEELRPDCPAGLDSILSRMLARDRAQRYPRCRDVEKDLMALCLRHGLMPSESDVAEVVATARGVVATDRDAAIRALFARAAGRAGSRRSTEAATEVPEDASPMLDDPTGATLLIPQGPRPAGQEANLWDLERADTRPVLDGSSTGEATSARTTAEPSTATFSGARRPRLGRLAALAAGLVAAVALGWAIASRPSGRPASTARVASGREPAASTGEVSDSRGGGEPAPRSAPATAAPANDPLDASVERAAASDASTAAPPPGPPHATHAIQISAIPWAHVYLGARRLGTSPSQRRFRLPRGTHVLTLSNPELGLSRRVKVTVPSDQVYRFDLRADKPGGGDAP